MISQASILSDSYHNDAFHSDLYFFRRCLYQARKLYITTDGFIGVLFGDGSSLIFKDNEAKTFYC